MMPQWIERVLGGLEELVFALPPRLVIGMIIVAMLVCALTYDNVRDLVHERHLRIQTEDFAQRQICDKACQAAISKFQSE
jgi:hypothetical protein